MRGNYAHDYFLRTQKPKRNREPAAVATTDSVIPIRRAVFGGWASFFSPLGFALGLEACPRHTKIITSASRVDGFKIESEYAVLS